MEKRKALIRTSDRAAFRRCRRKWSLSSSMGGNLQENEARGPLWGGTGFHYALEDFHGYNHYKHPAEAFKAFVRATRTAPGQGVPDDYEELTELFVGMLNYYVDSWLRTRNTLQTLWIDGVPQVEVRFEIPIPIPQDILDASEYDEVCYQGTIDRVVIDEHERIWLLDHKTAKQFSLLHLDMDMQVTSYCWAASVLFDKPITGFIYQQYKKDIPKSPRQLKNGTFSVAKNQITTSAIYRATVIAEYKEWDAVPQANKDYIASLELDETEEYDAVIRRDYLFRNEHQLASMGQNILLEAIDMINPNMLVYPNATRDCSWDCSFSGPCLTLEQGGDWESELALGTIKRDDLNATWKDYLT